MGLATDSAGGGLDVWVKSDSGAAEIPIAGSWLGAVHRYRVEWERDSTRVSIDDQPVVACASAVEESLQVTASDAGAGAPLRVLWMRLSPYADRGVFVSRVLDAGGSAALAITWAADVVGPGWIGLETRTGATPVPDASWSAYQSLAGTGAGLGPSPRYLQYRARLTTADPGFTPALRAVALSCKTVAGVGVADAAATRLLPPRPNPMTRGTRVTWDTGADRGGARLHIRVFDIAGRCVRTLFDAPSATGPHQVVWDGCDDRGGRLHAGIFRIRLEAPGLDRTVPVVLLR